MSKHNNEIIRPARDLENHYKEIYGLRCEDNDLLEILAEAEEDVKTGRVATMKDTFDELRNDILLSIKDRII